jgi:hypothetical protein
MYYIFTDGVNPVYSVNIDNLIAYVNTDIVESINPSSENGKIALANTTDGWDCNSFKLFPNLTVPCIELDQILESGGSLLTGQYHFTLRYLDNDLNPTNWFYLTNGVPIYNNNQYSDYNTITGGFNGEGSSDGSDAQLPPTNKSIRLSLTNLDTDFPFYQIGVVEYTDGNGTPRNVYKLEEVPITDTTDFYVYRGLNPDTDESTTIQEFQQPRVSVDTAKHLTIKDNRLLLANTKGKELQWAAFQRKASEIYSKYKIDVSSKQDINQYTPKSSNYYFYKTSYMRDEVYAFAIVWIFNDGSYSPAFHIPGRPKNFNPETCNAFVPLVNGGDTKRCITVGGNVTGPVTCSNGLTYTIVYSVDGVETTFTDTIKNSTFETYELFCTINNDTDLEIISFEYSVGDDCAGTASANIISTPYDETVDNFGNAKGNPSPQIYNPSFSNITGWDNTIIQLWNKDIAHIYPKSKEDEYNALPNSEKLKLWEVFNTAYKETDTSGFMAYYECSDSRYPKKRDCNGNSVWGTDVCGNALEDRPIRHHKFPDVNLEEIQNTESIRNIGVEFHNIEPPNEYVDQVQGYFIVRGDREDFNKTILDKGYLDRTGHSVFTEDNVDYDYYSYFRSDTTLDNFFPGTGTLGRSNDTMVFHSPKALYNRDFLNGSYFKIERKYEIFPFYNLNDPSTVYYNTEFCDSLNPDGQGGTQDMLDIYSFRTEGTWNVPGVNRPIAGSTYIDGLLPGSAPGQDEAGFVIANLNGREIRNYLGSTHLYYHNLSETLEDSFNSPGGNWGRHRYYGNIYYTSMKSNKDVYCSLQGIKYVKVSTCPHSKDDTSVTVFGGDIFITRMEWSLQDWDTSRTFMSGWVESELNIELSHSSGINCDERFLGSHWNGTDICQWITRYTSTQEFIAALEEDSDIYDKWLCRDPREYNVDFNAISPKYYFFPLPNNFDFCSDCIDNHPYRVWWSQQSFQEESIDNFRSFLANNYTDIMGDHGSIYNLFIDRDRLFIHAGKALWQIQTKPNEIKTTDATLFIGTGEFGSIPPKKLVETAAGYGGSRDKWSSVTTEFGTVFVDSDNGKVFNLNQGLEEISENGIRNWLENNLPISFLKEFKKLTNIDYYCARNTLSSEAVGIIATYDPRYRRYILHKRDFGFTTWFTRNYRGVFTRRQSVPGQLVGFIVWSIADNSFGILNSDGSINPISLEDSRYFENKSFTLSYSFKHKAWASFHSYMPNYMNSDDETFYSFKGNIRKKYSTHGDYFHPIWKHNVRNHQKYYDFKHDFVIDYVSAKDAIIEKVFGSVQYMSRVNLWDDVNKDYVEITDKTINKLYCYNTNQITGLLDVSINDTNYPSINMGVTDTLADRTDNIYKINTNLRDIAINRNVGTLFTSNWDDINYQLQFDIDSQGNGYTDKVINEINIDPNKDIYEKARLRDKWLGVRMFFNYPEDYRFTLQASITNKRNSVR